MAAPTPIIEMCFGGSIRPKLVDSGAITVHPLTDTSYEDGEVTEIIHGTTYQGIQDNVSRGDQGFLPEYGVSTGFNGISSTIYIEDAAALRPSTSFGIAFLFKFRETPASDQTIWRKENGGTGGRIVVGIRSTGPKLYVNANIGGVYGSDLEYTIPSVSDWTDNARLIVARYTGSTLQLIQVTMAGAVTTLATTAKSGAVGTGTNSRIYIGSNAAASEFLNAQLQWLSYWVDDYPLDAEITDIATSLVWTDITTDVAQREGIEAIWGMADGGPLSKVASVGTLQFALINTTTNSAGLTGYYSLDHANKRSGFEYGCPVRFSIVDPTTTETVVKFIGRLTQIHPIPGSFGRRVTECVAVDYIDELARAGLPAMPIIDGIEFSDIVLKIINSVPAKPHGVSGSVAPNPQSYSYGLDISNDESSRCIQELVRLCHTEWGALYMRGGILTLETRQTRESNSTVDWTFSNSMQGFDILTGRDRIITRVQCTNYPRTQDAGTTTVLYELTEPVFIAAGGEVTFRTPYTDPTNKRARVGIMKGTEASTHAANSQSDGLGTDLTAQTAVLITYGANTAELRMVNAGPSDVYITQLELQGRGVYADQPVVMQSKSTDELIARVGDNLLSIDQPYQDKPDRGYALAEYVRAGWEQERSIPRMLLLRVGDGSPSAVVNAAIEADIGDLVSITETVTGVAARHVFVNGVRLRVSSGNIVETELILAPRDLDAWLLGVANYGELGVSTRLGF